MYYSEFPEFSVIRACKKTIERFGYFLQALSIFRAFWLLNNFMYESQKNAIKEREGGVYTYRCIVIVF